MIARSLHKRLLCGLILLSACLVVALTYGQSARADGEPKRVIILDASGSMRKADFRAQPNGRLEQAKLVLNAHLDLLLASGDTVPTALHVFGAELSWDDALESANGRFTSASNYPIDGPLCGDVRTLLDFSPLSLQHAAQAKSKASTVRWNGMTPIHVSLIRAIKAMGAGAQGEIILISDLERPNCLPPGLTICEAIEPELAELRRSGGSVEVTIFETPVAKLKQDLSECLPVVSVRLNTNAPNPSSLVSRVAAYSRVEPDYRFDTATPDDPDGLQKLPLSLTAIDARTNERVASGPVAALRLPNGRYRFETSDGAQTWGEDVEVGASGLIALSLPPAQLIVEAEDDAGRTIDALASLEVRRRGRPSPVASQQNQTLPARLDLANASYEISGTLPNGQSASTNVVLRLGTTKTTRLTFGGAGQRTRSVSISLNIERPSLEGPTAFSPTAILRSRSGQETSLSPGLNQVDLTPGLYEVIVSSGTPHRIAFEISQGVAVLDIQVEVTPGWFSARSTSGLGEFVLEDSKGVGLYSFSGDHVTHSLPDGSYRMEFVRDGKRTAHSFEISAGRHVELPPF